MKRGFVHIIPALIVAIVLSLGGIGFVAKQRTQTLENQVLSSSDINKEVQQKPANSQSQLLNNKNRGSTPKPTAKKDTTKTGVTSQVKIEDSTRSASPTATPGRKIRTNFPITVNPLTGEKIVTTPSGVHIVILPEVAIRNMIKAGFPVVLPPEPLPSPTSSPQTTPSATPEGTASSSPEAGGTSTSDGNGVVLTELSGKPVYEIPAIKKQKFLGILAINIKLTGYVSAENGNIITTKKSFFNNILDALSF